MLDPSPRYAAKMEGLYYPETLVPVSGKIQYQIPEDGYTDFFYRLLSYSIQLLCFTCFGDANKRNVNDSGDVSSGVSCRCIHSICLYLIVKL